MLEQDFIIYKLELIHLLAIMPVFCIQTSEAKGKKGIVQKRVARKYRFIFVYGAMAWRKHRVGDE
jgi:hypothetical protein